MMEITHVDFAPTIDKRPAVLTIGKFDGVHLGHQYILKQALKLKQPSEILATISFSPHPLWALKRMEDYREMITPPREKAYWLGRYGVDRLFETAFTAAYAETSPEEFVCEHLANLNLSHICVGEEFNFGKGRHSDVELLRDLAEPFGIKVVAVPVVPMNNEKISSTYIRSLLRRGAFKEAERLLGHAWYVNGVVKDGVIADEEDYVLPLPGEYETLEHGRVKVTSDRKILVDSADGELRLRFVG